MKTHFSTRRLQLSMAVAIFGTSSLAIAGLVGAQGALPSGPGDVAGLPAQDAVKKALTDATRQSNGGLANEMWATIENRDGFICAVAYTGEARGDQWPGSRVISAQKANTAAAFSLPPGKG